MENFTVKDNVPYCWRGRMARMRRRKPIDVIFRYLMDTGEMKHLFDPPLGNVFFQKQRTALRSAKRRRRGTPGSIPAEKGRMMVC